MSQTTRDSYQDTKNYVELTFQYRKDVLDSEMNELQKIWRSQLYKGNQAFLNSSHVIANSDGGRVTSDGVTANQIIIKAGFLVANGYAVYIATDITVTGLTTPGANREDNVYMSISETEVTSAVDAAIMVAKLGETTVRKQMSVAFTVDQGSASPPASGVAPYLGGTQYVLLAHISRANGVAVIPTTAFIDYRSRSLPTLMAQDRNVSIRSFGISWDGTTLSISSFTLQWPNETNKVAATGITVTPADGNAIGWLSAGFQDRLRRKFLNDVNYGSTYPANTQDNMGSLAAFSAVTAIADSQFSHGVFVIGVRSGTQIFLRDGSVLNAGDYMHQWGQPGGLVAAAESTTAPQMQYRTYNSKQKATIDHLGYRGGALSEWEEHWRPSTLADWTASSSSVTKTGTDPTSTFPQRYMAFGAPGAGVTFSNGYIVPSFTAYMSTDSVITMEGIVQTTSGYATAVGDHFGWGFQFSHAGAFDYYMIFRWINGTTNMQFSTIGSSTVDTDTGLAFTNTTNYRLRIEITGTNNNSVGGFQAKGYANGNLVATQNFANIPADLLRPCLAAKNAVNTSGIASPCLLVGRIRHQFNHLLTPDRL